MFAAKIIMCAWLKMAKCLKNPYVFEAKSPNTCRFQTSTLQGASFRGSPDKVPHHPKQSAWRLWKPGNIWDFTMKQRYIYIDVSMHVHIQILNSNVPVNKDQTNGVNRNMVKKMRIWWSLAVLNQQKNGDIMGICSGHKPKNMYP
jgi:hypothetical protein